MPDDYYVSQYSGEEIDERLTAAHNAVRYDAAQTLADAQKTQARGNISAAPDGYGLGTSAVAIDDYNNAVTNGWYSGGNNYPSKISYASYGMVRVDNNGITKLQTFYAGDTGNAMISPFMAIRKSTDYGATWSEWEYVNPPMILGVEYRTTERYLGKPVYVKVVDCGLVVDNKIIDLGLSNPAIITDAVVILQKRPGPAFYTSTGLGNYGFSYFIDYYYGTPHTCSIAFHVGASLNATPSQGYATIKYTKTTD